MSEHDKKFGKDAPFGFAFVTNIGPECEIPMFGAQPDEVYLDGLAYQYGRDNVAVTTPAYDVYGNEWNGRAVHVRKVSRP